MSATNNQLAQLNNEQIKPTVKIRLAKLQSEFLGDFCYKVVIGRINKDYVVEQCVVAELYKRYHERFSFRKSGDFTLKAFEVISLKRLLMDTPMAEPVAISMRDELVGILHKEIHFMQTSRKAQNQRLCQNENSPPVMVGLNAKSA